jgi:hypothetical protein
VQNVIQGRWLRAALLGATLALALGGWSLGTKRVAQAQPVRPAIDFDPGLWRDRAVTKLGPGKGIGLVRVGARAGVEPFNTQRAVLTFPSGVTIDQLRKDLDKVDKGMFEISLVPDTAPPITRRPPRTSGHSPAGLPLRPLPVPPRRSYYLRLQPLAEALARDEMSKVFQSQPIKFDSLSSLQALGRILFERRRLKPLLPNLELTASFVAAPTGLVPRDLTEGPGAPKPGEDLFWKVHDLTRAWQLSQVANPATKMDISVGIVDQGFGKSPAGVVWDLALPTPDALNVPNDLGDPWHGAMCGSAMNAAVGDGYGASGSALLGTGGGIDMLVQRHVRTIAYQMPPGSKGEYAPLANGIRRVVNEGAKIVSVSYAGNCGATCDEIEGAKELLSAVKAANDAGAIVLFAAGNDNVDLNQDGYQYFGCEAEGVLCIGGLDRQPVRWEWLDLSYGSNYGAATALFGPAHGVWVNPNSAKPKAFEVDGTSLATPFLAGALALVEASWGETFGLQQLRTHLNKPDVLYEGWDMLIKKRILNVYELMRVKAKVAPDGREPNDNPAAAKNWEPLGEPELLSLHDQDRDLLPIKVSACERTTVQVDYLRDDKRGELKAALIGKGPASPLAGGPHRAVLELTQDLCPDDYTLDLSTTNGFTTGYTVYIERSAIACPTSCGSPIPKIVPGGKDEKTDKGCKDDKNCKGREVPKDDGPGRDDKTDKGGKGGTTAPKTTPPAK